MYVCVCNGVTEHDIRNAVASGCATLGDLTMYTGCGATCGSCLEMAADLLAEAAPKEEMAPMRAPRAHASWQRENVI